MDEDWTDSLQENEQVARQHQRQDELNCLHHMWSSGHYGSCGNFHQIGSGKGAPAAEREYVQVILTLSLSFSFSVPPSLSLPLCLLLSVRLFTKRLAVVAYASSDLERATCSSFVHLRLCISEVYNENQTTLRITQHYSATTCFKHHTQSTSWATYVCIETLYEQE